MQTIQLVLLLLAAAALGSAAPTAGDDYDYNYDNYDYNYGGYEAGRDVLQLPSSVFDNLKPQPAKRQTEGLSPCSWAVVQCCGVANRMGARASCFSRVGCSGAWFSDICTPSIQKNVLRSIISSQQVPL